ncbi:unnamed protein product [Plutella xylostella]|uniref:(diamondback moth) hypothetical protein n=1 Tax=Plutella xylostella TaxID=51655 RepID=A0A8S4EU07_PLUXY|nr:unnamed protein product [Plutella xylostella]
MAHHLLPLIRQTFVMTSAIFQTLVCGLILGFPTILFAALTQPDSDIEVDENTATTIVAIRGFGFFTFSILIFVVLQKIGRRRTQILSVLPGIAGWILCYFAHSALQLMVMHVMLGLHLGAALSVVTMVIGEYSSPRYRGVFLMVKTAFIASGVATVHILGAYFHWRIVALMALIPNVLSLAIAPFWPESPYWLASVGRFDECIAAFYWLRGKGAEDQEELDDLLNKHKERIAAEGTNQGLMRSIMRHLMYLKNRDFLKLVLLVMMMNNLVEFSGRYVLNTYSISILQTITDSQDMAYKITIFLDLLTLVLSFATAILVKVMKRRTILFSTSLMSMVCLFICSLLLYLKTHNMIPSYFKWVAIIIYSVYIAAMSIGVLPIVIGYFGEIFPVLYKPLAGMLVGAYGVALNSFMNKVTPPLMTGLGPHGTFLVFAISMFLCLCFLYPNLPETKDRTLQDIENKWEVECGKTKNTKRHSVNTEMVLLSKKNIDQP